MTPNFTGNYRHGRHVNLAHGSSPRSSQSVLKDATAARVLREQARRRERAAVAIQSFYRGRKDIARARDCMREDFKTTRSVAMFVFFFEKGESADRVRDRELVPLLGDVSGIDPALKAKLAGVLVRCLSDAVEPAEWISAALRLLRSLQNYVPVSDLFAKYAVLLERDIAVNDVFDNISPTLTNHAARVAFVTKILATPHLFDHSTRAMQMLDFNSVLDILATTNYDEDPFWLLANVLSISSTITVPLMRALANVILSSRSKTSLSKQHLDTFVLNKLNPLKERKNLDLAIAHASSDTVVVCSYFVALTRLWPSKSSEIRYYLYLTPELALPLFFTTISRSLLFTLSSSDVDNSDYEILALFLDICWHWMIMTDDDEFFDESQYGLSLDDVRALGTFLKSFVYLIITNDSPTIRGQIKLNLPPSLNRIKADAVGIMRQIYYRDSRRQFLPERFWLISGLDVALFASQAIDAQKDYEMSEINTTDTEEDQDDDDEPRPLMFRVMSPRIEILQKIPFVLPFEARVEILDKSLELDRFKFGLDRDYELRFKRHSAQIRREHMLEDAFAQLNELKSELKSLIGITFVNEFGVEAGIDGGGITKEFLVGVCKDGFDPAKGLFLETSENLLYPNPAATGPDQLARFEFLGRIIGKAIYQGILVEVSFAQFFLSKWQVHNTVFGSGFRNTFDDLWSLDPDLYAGLIKLKKYDGDVESDFGLNFTITNSHNQTIELVRGGAQIPVTSANRLKYIHAVANYKLNNELYLQTSAFLSGMNDLLSPAWLVMFSAKEIQTLVGGAALPIDIDDWARHTVYGGFLESDPTIVYFWQVVREMTDEEVRSLLKFVTSVSRAPLQGFGSLKPAFTIREAGLVQARLPTSSTCVNMLKLPRYESKELLRSKLLFAVTAGAGFDLS